MPNGEECVGRGFFLSSLRFDWEGYTQLQETEDREEKHYFKTKTLQHEITENYTNYCETWQSYADMQNMIANLGIMCFLEI